MSETEITNNNDSIDAEITKLEVALKHKGNYGSNILMFTTIFLCILFAIFGKDVLISIGMTDSVFAQYAPLFGIGMTFYFIVAMSFILTLRSSKKLQVEQDLGVLKVKRKTFGTLSEQQNSDSYFDRLVNINVSNLDAYYSMVKIHTNNSFLASISSGAIGFMLIITGVLIGFTDLKNAQSIAYISSGSGVIIEFISGVFFYLYNQTTRQLKEYHDSLIDIQNILLSFKIIEETHDTEAKTNMSKIMIESLVKKK